MKTTISGSLLRNAGSVCLLLFALSQGRAQSQAPADTRSLVRITQVKPDMVTEWLAIQKNEVNPALKKGGVASRTLLETVLGNQYEYVSITPMGSYSEMDADTPLIKGLGKDGGAKLLTKIRKCIDGQTMFVSTRLAEFSSVPKNSAAIWTTVRYRAAPGKNQDFENYLRTDLIPVYSKATAAGKIAGYSVSRRGPVQQLGTERLSSTRTKSPAWRREPSPCKCSDRKGRPSLSRRAAAWLPSSTSSFEGGCQM